MSPHKKNFRSNRYKLPPEAFAIHPDGPEPPPRDVVEPEIWGGIITLPDDVSMRTSDDYGTELKAMYELWGSFIEMSLESKGGWSLASLDMADALQACTFNSLCGYYRVAASCLRAAIESIVIGTYLQLEETEEQINRWQKGEFDISFGSACDRLSKSSKVTGLEKYLRDEIRHSIFHHKTPTSDPGWARALYGELSNFSHNRPNYSEVSLWDGSNGPIFISSSFGYIYIHFLSVCALSYVLAKICHPGMTVPISVNWLYESKRVRTPIVVTSCFEYLGVTLLKTNERT